MLGLFLGLGGWNISSALRSFWGGWSRWKSLRLSAFWMPSSRRWWHVSMLEIEQEIWRNIHKSCFFHILEQRSTNHLEAFWSVVFFQVMSEISMFKHVQSTKTLEFKWRRHRSLLVSSRWFWIATLVRCSYRSHDWVTFSMNIPQKIIELP